MAAVTPYIGELVSPVVPSRMFKALVLDSHIVIPKVVPWGIKSVEFVKGDGDVGTIKQTNFAYSGKLKYMRHRMDALDIKNLYCKYTLIGSDVRFEARADGGCFCSVMNEYHAKSRTELKKQDIRPAGLGGRSRSASSLTRTSVLKGLIIYRNQRIIHME